MPQMSAVDLPGPYAMVGEQQTPVFDTNHLKANWHALVGSHCLARLSLGKCNTIL